MKLKKIINGLLENKNEVIIFTLFWILFTLIIFFNQKTILTNISDYDRFTVSLIISFGWFILSPIIIWFANQALKKDNKIYFILIHATGNIVLLFVRALIHAFLIINVIGSDFSYIDTYHNVLKKWGANPTFIYLLLVSSYYVYVWFKKYKKAELVTAKHELNIALLEKQLLDSKLQTLRSQLNPHFLFNALHSIGSLIRLSENNTAIEVLVKLSDLLRFALKENSNLKTSIEEEIDFLKKYLDIECLRFRDRIKVEWDVDKSVYNYEIPSLMLQPLIENAFKHGLKDISNAILKIKIYSNQENDIVFSLFNNGNLLKESFSLNENCGLGLNNTKDRLLSSYGTRAKIQMYNSNDPIGVITEIFIPKE